MLKALPPGSIFDGSGSVDRTGSLCRAGSVNRPAFGRTRRTRRIGVGTGRRCCNPDSRRPG
jgi:hypothetical protein